MLRNKNTPLDLMPSVVLLSEEAITNIMFLIRCVYAVALFVKIQKNYCMVVIRFK